jgi:alpha-ketoglutarate-dependent taurine dioxygenase/acyl carrier protein
MGVKDALSGSGIEGGIVDPERGLPLLLSSKAEETSLLAWVRRRRDAIRSELDRCGAILFRGFHVDGPAEFERIIEALAGSLMEYRDRATPRSHVHGRIYTSTDYPPHSRIFLHCENSFSDTWPMTLFFYCVTPPIRGGETPIADVRRVYRRIDPAVRERFERLGVMYVRNFGRGLGLSWQDAFQTADRSRVEERCRQGGMTAEWTADGGLRVRHVRPAVAKHPRTREPVWFNHGAVFHVTALEPELREKLLREVRSEDLPSNSYYGDGTPIEPEVIEAVRQAYLREAVHESWRQGDVLMVDNMLVAHGRMPFEGPRKIVVGMAEPSGPAPEPPPAAESGPGGNAEPGPSISEPVDVRGLAASICAIFSQVLGRGDVSASDNFFQLGGDSLLATRVLNRIRSDMGVEVPIVTFARAPTASALADFVSRSRADLRLP